MIRLDGIGCVEKFLKTNNQKTIKNESGKNQVLY